MQHLGDQQLHQLLCFLGCDFGGPYLALSFSPDMPALPRRTPFFHRLQHFLPGRRQPLRIHPGACHRDRIERPVDDGLDRVRSAERCGGLGMPGGALLGQGAGFVFGVPGLQGRLLRQLQRLHRGRRPTMITLKPGRQYTLPVLDQHPPRRPPLVQRRVNTDDLTHRPLTQLRVGSIGEPHPQPVAEMMLQGSVISLRRSHGGFEQHPAVDRQPPPVQGLDLVRHRHMSVQIRITGPGVPVGESGRHQAADVDLPDPVPSLPGEQRVALDEAQRILHGSLMRQFDLRGDLRVGDRPQRRHRLHRGEGQVIAGNRLGARTRLLSDSRGDLAGIHRIAAMLWLGRTPAPPRYGPAPEAPRRLTRPRAVRRPPVAWQFALPPRCGMG